MSGFLLGRRTARALWSATLGLVLGTAAALGGSLVIDQAAADERTIDCPNRPGENPNCVGHEHKDNMWGRAGVDYMAGHEGGDLLAGRGDADYLDGNMGPDTILGGGDFDHLNGYTGCDLAAGDDGVDVIHGGPDDDWSGCGGSGLLGDQMIDIIYGDEGKDDLFGGYGDDQLQGGPGDDDFCKGGPGDDDFTGCEFRVED